MTITLKLFAAYREALGSGELLLEVAPGTTVAQVLTRLVQDHPELGRWQTVTRFGVNQAFVSAETPLQQGDEVVFIPPVSGG